MADKSRDVGSWLQATIAGVALLAAFFSWYTNQSSKANAAEVVGAHDTGITSHVSLVAAATENHNDRSDSHFEYRDSVSQQLHEQSEVVIRLEASNERIEDKVERAGATAKENRTDIKEILTIIREQQRGS